MDYNRNNCVQVEPSRKTSCTHKQANTSKCHHERYDRRTLKISITICANQQITIRDICKISAKTMPQLLVTNRDIDGSFGFLHFSLLQFAARITIRENVAFFATIFGCHGSRLFYFVSQERPLFTTYEFLPRFSHLARLSSPSQRRKAQSDPGPKTNRYEYPSVFEKTVLLTPRHQTYHPGEVTDLIELFSTR